ncbi:CapA family protein [Streptomyces bambusae]|uniref:Capsule synthesis protein CapA domain-containing protein n=1 Tax=Streptomyces bambusae TaxID=1550616 RepID=A0ABS6Z9P3_9ACTN|nr:CapA family protein [Streptomyces bambusae]MBW5484499.1 hypothetical protein [Streptomyces bambusae]
MGGDLVKLFLSGDVMLGRGVDQILPHPGDPALAEAYLKDARSYVRLAEEASGPVPRGAAWTWPWGDALRILDAAAPDVRIVNLETSVTEQGESVPGKAVHYRMHPQNLPCLAVARPDVCSLANNHVMDYGRRGLTDTLDSLADAGFTAAGAGRDLDAARRPAAVPLPGGGRVLVFCLGTESSGIPPGWAATPDRSGVHLVPETPEGAAEVTSRIREAKRPGDLAVVSVHFGSNWGYGVPADRVRFAHALVDGGADLVHGHSSHHPRPLEVYRGRLVTYGCGDLIDDYEGIGGYEGYRDDLRPLYFPVLDRRTGALREARVVVLRAHRMRLRPAGADDCAWLGEVLERVSSPYGAHVGLLTDGALSVTAAA